ncbi:TolC family protein [Solimonas sp. K1W22B-7]|uniref:TolC family protein n=1 Tax=Solimonas sp. K1W22B-7 TaxID=2303331 RepID=UPI0013C476D0|nr:TolC family protein [Solimonas sp. K1W22B-7]
MSKSPIFRLLCLVLLCPGLAQANDLLRVYKQALNNDATLAASRYAREAALQNEPKARALLLPQLSGSYDYVFNDSEVEVTYVDPATGAAIPLSRKNDGTDKSLSITLSQPLFSLEAWYQFKQASEQAALAQLSYRSSEQDLLLRVAELYFGVLGARDALRSATAERTALEQQLELARQHLQVGLSSITDTQEVQARYDLSLASELEAGQTLATAIEGLEEITREPLRSIEEDQVRVVPLEAPAARPPALAALQEDIPLPMPQPASADQWVAQTRVGNFELLGAKLNFNVADRGVSAARSRQLPTVAATANYLDSRSEAGAFPTDLSGTSVGIGVRLLLFSGGATRAGIRQAEAVRGQRLAEYDGARRAVERNARNAFQAVVTGAARVHALKQAVASSGSALEASEVGLEIGTRSAIDVLNARQQRYVAERNYDRSRYEYLLAVLRLKAVAGRLVLQDLAQVDGLLVQDALAQP